MMNDKYSIKWFKDRAFKSIKRIDSKSWDFSDSLLFYTPKAVEAYEELQEGKTLYNRFITKPETEFISEIADKIAGELPDRFYYIDLGPGTEHKERFFFEAFQSQNKNFTYIPVDVSNHILNIVNKFADKFNIKTKRILSSFEECEQYLPKDSVYRFVSLGLTFVNYHIQDILSLLKRIIGDDGSAFIDIHARDRIDLEKIKETYSEQTNSILADKIELLGLDFKKNVKDLEVNDKVEIWFTIQNPTEKLKKIGIKNGDRILVIQSLRYNLNEVKSEISKIFSNHSVFDIDEPFVGFLLKS